MRLVCVSAHSGHPCASCWLVWRFHSAPTSAASPVSMAPLAPLFPTRCHSTTSQSPRLQSTAEAASCRHARGGAASFFFPATTSAACRHSRLVSSGSWRGWTITSTRPAHLPSVAQRVCLPPPQSACRHECNGLARRDTGRAVPQHRGSARVAAHALHPSTPLAPGSRADRTLNRGCVLVACCTDGKTEPDKVEEELAEAEELVSRRAHSPHCALCTPCAYIALTVFVVLLL